MINFEVNPEHITFNRVLSMNIKKMMTKKGKMKNQKERMIQ
jgi:hypothetical protein